MSAVIVHATMVITTSSRFRGEKHGLAHRDDAEVLLREVSRRSDQ